MKPIALAARLALAALLALAPQTAIAQTPITKGRPAAEVMFNVNKLYYTVDELKADRARLLAALKPPVDSGPQFEEWNRKLSVTILAQRIQAILIRQFCADKKIYVSDPEVSAAIASMMKGMPQGADDSSLAATLYSQSVFIDTRSYITQSIMMDKYLQQKMKDDKVSPREPSSDEIMKAYDLMKSSLIRPDTARVSMLIADNAGATDADRRKVLDTMHGLADQLRNAPSKFDEILLKANDPGSIYKGIASALIDKTPQRQSSIGPKLFDAIFSLKAGEISALVENGPTLVVVRVNESLPQKQMTLTDTLNVNGLGVTTVQNLIIMQFQQNELDAIQAKMMDEASNLIYKDAEVKINLPYLTGLLEEKDLGPIKDLGFKSLTAK
jgi:hypothetical protein